MDDTLRGLPESLTATTYAHLRLDAAQRLKVLLSRCTVVRLASKHLGGVPRIMP